MVFLPQYYLMRKYHSNLIQRENIIVHTKDYLAEVLPPQQHHHHSAKCPSQDLEQHPHHYAQCQGLNMDLLKSITNQSQ